MSTHGTGPEEGSSSSPDRDAGAGLALPITTVPSGVRSIFDTLSRLEGEDKSSKSFTVKRFSLVLNALTEAESLYIACEESEGEQLDILGMLLQRACESAGTTLSAAKRYRDSMSSEQAELSTIVADKAASMWTQFFVPEDAEQAVRGITKDLIAILKLGNQNNIEELPRTIEASPNLTPLASFGLWGVSSALLSAVGARCQDAGLLGQAQNCFFYRAKAASLFVQNPPRQLALLKPERSDSESSDAFQVASEILLDSVFSATEKARADGIFLRAQRVLDFVSPIVARLNPTQVRAWLEDYTKTCNQARALEEFDCVRKMLGALRQVVNQLGDPVVVDALRVTASCIKNELDLNQEAAAQEGIREFRERFAKLPPEKKGELHVEALKVGQAAIVLLLREAITAPFFERAQGLLREACDEVDAMSSIAEVGHQQGTFMVAESLLHITQAHLKREDLPEARERALEVWQRARAVLDAAERHPTEDVLYARAVCRTQLAEVGTTFEDPALLEPLRESLERLWAPLVTKIEQGAAGDYEGTQYHYAQVELLRALASLQSSWAQHASEGDGGVATIRKALSLYERYSLPDTNNSLIRSLYEVAVAVLEKRQLYAEARQYEEKLERLG